MDSDEHSRSELPVSKSWAEYTTIYNTARLNLWFVKRVVICKRWQHHHTSIANISQQHTRKLLREQHLYRRSEYQHIWKQRGLELANVHNLGGCNMFGLQWRIAFVLQHDGPI